MVQPETVVWDPADSSEPGGTGESAPPGPRRPAILDLLMPGALVGGIVAGSVSAGGASPWWGRIALALVVAAALMVPTLAVAGLLRLVRLPWWLARAGGHLAAAAVLIAYFMSWATITSSRWEALSDPYVLATGGSYLVAAAVISGLVHLGRAITAPPTLRWH